MPGDFSVPERGSTMHRWEGCENCDASNESPETKLQRIRLPDFGEYPADFTCCNEDGVNYRTQFVNQHIPQHCESCWAQASMSALSDRIKMARGAKGIDIQISVQHVLNCGNAGLRR